MTQRDQVLSAKVGKPVYDLHGTKIGVVSTDKSPESVGGTHLVVVPSEKSSVYWRIPANFVAEVDDGFVELHLVRSTINAHPEWHISHTEVES